MLFRSGYQFPMTVNKTEEQLPGAFAPSAIQQIGSLGTLVGASFNSKGTGAGDRLIDFIGDKLSGFGGSSNSGGTNTGFTEYTPN